MAAKFDAANIPAFITQWLSSGEGPTDLVSASAFIDWAQSGNHIPIMGPSERAGLERQVNAAMRSHPLLEQINTGNRTTTFRRRTTVPA